MASVIKQGLVFSERLRGIPGDFTAPLRPHISGPEAELHRYSISAEKSLIGVGEYNPSADTTYNWPAKQTGSRVDLPYVHVHIDNALLQYYNNALGSGDTLAPISGYDNRVGLTATRGFKTNTSSYPRLAELGSRDVAVNDTVKLTNGTVTLWTYVKNLIPDVVAGTVGSASAGASNASARPPITVSTTPTVNVTGGGSTGGSLQAGDYYVRFSFVGSWGETWASPASTQFTVSAGNRPRVTLPTRPAGVDSISLYVSDTDGAATTCRRYAAGITASTYDMTGAHTPSGALYPKDTRQVAGTVNDITAVVADASLYNGTTSGDLTETYTVEVTQASTGGDATTARLRITSASGRDDVSSFVPAAFGSPTNIGTRGHQVTFDRTSDNFVVGQKWTTTIQNEWALPAITTSTVAGSFTSNRSFGYVVTVTRGGFFTDTEDPQITAVSTDGSDRSGPTTIATTGVAYEIGTKGVTFSFATSTGLRYGDTFVVDCVAESTGHYKKIELGHNLPAALKTATDLTMTLYMKRNIVVPATRTTDPSLPNWVASLSSLVMKAGVAVYDNSFIRDGDPVPLPVMGGTVYLGYRAWLPTRAGSIHAVSTPAQAETLFGGSAKIHPDNPLAYAVYKATQNSDGLAVKFTALANPDDINEWQEVLDSLEGEHDIFSLVPLSRNSNVWSRFCTHVLSRSDDDVGGEWRNVWFSPVIAETTPIATSGNSSNGQQILATLVDNPAVTGTQYTQLLIQSSNIELLAVGVAPGDTVRYLYELDSLGNEVYRTFTVESVVNEQTLVLTAGHTEAVSVARKVEIHRRQSRTQLANALLASIGSTDDKRFRFILPDSVVDNLGLTVPGYFLAAAYAAFTGSVAPQQGIRSVAITGFSSTARLAELFANAQLNDLGAGGFFLVATATTGEVYARNASTADATSESVLQEATVRLGDAVRYAIFAKADTFHGVSNINDETRAAIFSELQATLNRITSATLVERIGPMIGGGKVTNVRASLTDVGRMVVEATVDIPAVHSATTLLLTL